MNYENKVIEALCNDERIWKHLDEICEAYGFDSCSFYDKHGRMIDRRRIAEDLVKDFHFLNDYAYRYGITLEDLDIPYDIMDDFYGEVTEKVLRAVLKEAFENNDEELSPFEEDKWGRGNFDLDESKQRINEAFKSNELRNWFKLHGGVKKVWEDFPEMNVTQDGLGDVTDNDIMYLEEFPNIRDARNRVWDLNHEKNNYGQRSERNIKNLYTMYKANDGYCLVVGLNRNNIETGVNWGGEHTKKKSNRIWRDDKDPESYRAGKYIDDKDKYYYSRKGQDFGLRTNKDFKRKMSDNNNIRNKMSDKQWKEYQTMRVNDMDDYLNKYYGKRIK